MPHTVARTDLNEPATMPLQLLWIRAATLLLTGALSACGGDYSGGRQATGNPGNPDGDGPPAGGDARSHFEARVQGELEFCRTCHIPEGVADTNEGRRFMLSEDTREDYDRTFAAWETMGGGVDTSLLLTMPAGTADRSHSGGEPWPEGSQAHADMRVLLQCWDDPDNCGSDQNSSPAASSQALLGSRRGGHVWADYCAGRSDNAALPADPRHAIRDGSNGDRAVVFNIDWKACALNEPLRPETCGEYRALYAIGERVGRGQGEVGTAHMFSGDAANGINPADPSTYDFSRSFWTITAENYNSVWRSWTGYGLPPAGRPDNFDALIAHRYGSPLPAQRNPYPLPGEDPNATQGGSGQLPVALTQLRDPDGNWTGTIGVKLCSLCHDGHLEGAGMDSQVVYGGSGTIGDFTVAFRDFAASGAPQFGLLSGLPLTIAANRGTGAIDQFQIGFIAFNSGTPQEFTNDKILLSQAIGNIKSPPWWNMGSRPQKFHGAVLPTDSARIDMAAYFPLGGGPSDAEAWVDSVAYPFQIWAESLKSPAYPGPIDEDLARQGAILFHAKDLWASELNNPVPAPAERGNGACASCHGAYSPRYVNDNAYLAEPRFEGIAANVTPLSVIGTDPAYAEAMQSLRNADGSTNVAYDDNVFLECGIGAAAETPGNTPIMLAPPLYGVWASAPYFHNASVPNVWGVLDPASERPDIWVRQSAPAPEGLEGRVVTGFDTNLDRAYDHDRLGWKYRELDCVADAAQTAPLLSCNPLPVGLGDDPGPRRCSRSMTSCIRRSPSPGTCRWMRPR